MKAVFLPVINRDLLKLVHLSNGFQLLPGAETLEAGDACISSVKNTDAGKAVQVKGCVFRDSKPTIEVSSSFLYHDCFSDFENTFETIDEPNYVVELPDAAAVGVIKSKEWLAWEDNSQPIKAGITCFPCVFSGHLQGQDFLLQCLCHWGHVPSRPAQASQESQLCGLQIGRAHV